MITAKEKKDKTTQLIKDLAGDLKPEVDKIESSIKTTQNHYGRYMSILGGFNSNQINLISLALIEAGANRGGVLSALKVLVG